MLAIIDARSPMQAIENLSKYTEDIFLFGSAGLTYNSISGHPDIFIFQDNDKLIIAPNTPEQLFNFLKKYRIDYKTGCSIVGKDINNTVNYNCIVTDNFLFHKRGMTDESILKSSRDKTFIDLPQAYTRCSMIHIGKDIFISSDRGITKALDRHNLENVYFSPEDIKIFDHKNGFFGGTCGIFQNKIFFNGNIEKHKHGIKLRNFLTGLNYEVFCLHDDFLYDGGGIFFIF